MAQVILSNKQSNSGSPYVIYSVEVTPSNRTMTTIDLAFKITSHLKDSSSRLGTGNGYGLKGRLTINGKTLWWDNDTSKEGFSTQNAPILKGRNNSWSGTGNHSVSYTYTLTEIAWDTTSIPVSFYVIRTSGNTANAGYLKNTDCTPISIERGAAPSTITSASSGTTDFAPSITWTPLDSTFKFKLRYYYSNWEYYTGFITPNTTNPYTYNGYTISGSTLAPYMTNATGGTFGVTLYTYDSGGGYIGESSSNFNVTLNGNIVPSVSFTRVVEAGDVPSSWGIYVKNKSRIGLTISGSGIYGSSISSYRISYYGGAVTTASATTSYIQNTGNVTFTGQVTDTRGRSASTTATINVVDYSNPTISTAQVQRCDANGNIDNNGEYMYISYGASISSCSNKNTPSAVYKVGYRVHNTGDYTYVNLTTNANSYSASGVLFTDGIKAASATGTKVQFSTSNTYDIIFYVKDYFMEYTNVQSLDTGFDLMNFNPSGKAMAIGKVSEASANEEKLEIGIDTDIDGDVTINGQETLNDFLLVNIPNTRVGNNIMLRGTTTYPEASINYANANDLSESYIVGYGVGGDDWGIYNTKVGTIFTLDKYGNINVYGNLEMNNVTRMFAGNDGSTFIGANGNNIVLRPNGATNDSNQVVIGKDANGWGNLPRATKVENVSFDYMAANYPSGFYEVNANDNNAPFSSTWYHLLQMLADDGGQWVYQEVVQWWTIPITKYARLKSGGTWSSWQQVW